MNPFLLACIEGDLKLLPRAQPHELHNGFRYACREGHWNVIRTLMGEYRLSESCMEDGMCWAAAHGREKLLLFLQGSTPPTNRLVPFLCWGKLYSRLDTWIREYGLDLSWVDMKGKQEFLQFLYAKIQCKSC